MLKPLKTAGQNGGKKKVGTIEQLMTHHPIHITLRIFLF